MEPQPIGQGGIAGDQPPVGPGRAGKKERQVRWWILTLPGYTFVPFLPRGVVFIKGQRECGAGGFDHWQVVICCERTQRMSWIKQLFGSTVHAESIMDRDAALEYVEKEETGVEGTRFQLGKLPVQRSSAKDWESTLTLAKCGRFDEIDACSLICHYNSIKRIYQDNLQPVPVLRKCLVFWGSTGTGKSRSAWEQAGFSAYPKSPRTKFWDGYSGQDKVVIDEFRGIIDVALLLTWTDRYPVIVENKGSSIVLVASEIWITSNLHPKDWYPGLDVLTLEALLRRLTVTHFVNL